MATVVFVSIFNCRHTQHKDHGNHGQLFTERIDGRDPVQTHYEHKVDISHAVKLLKEVLGYEVPPAVFCCFNQVAMKTVLVSTCPQVWIDCPLHSDVSILYCHHKNMCG